MGGLLGGGEGELILLPLPELGQLLDGLLLIYSEDVLVPTALHILYLLPIHRPDRDRLRLLL